MVLRLLSAGTPVASVPADACLGGRIPEGGDGELRFRASRQKCPVPDNALAKTAASL